MNVVFFNPSIRRFINSFDDETRIKLVKTLDLLEKFGHELRMPHSKRLQRNVYELRIHGDQPIRLLYTFHRNSALILHGFIKKSQKAPQREIKIALKRLRNLQ